MSRQDMDLILNDGINTAVHFIEKSGEFFPFGVVKTSNGEIRHIQAMMEDPHPTSDGVIEVLKISLRKGVITGDYDTVAIVSNVGLTDKKAGHIVDAISISVDDKNSNPILCYVPYGINDGVPVLGDIQAGTGTRIAFTN